MREGLKETAADKNKTNSSREAGREVKLGESECETKVKVWKCRTKPARGY